jgi:hypothetical protein
VVDVSVRALTAIIIVSFVLIGISGPTISASHSSPNGIVHNAAIIVLIVSTSAGLGALIALSRAAVASVWQRRSRVRS